MVFRCEECSFEYKRNVPPFCKKCNGRVINIIECKSDRCTNEATCLTGLCKDCHKFVYCGSQNVQIAKQEKSQ